MDEKVTDINYKRMDKDPDLKRDINAMERMFLGEKGLGIMAALGLTPGRIQKGIDEQREAEFNRILEENKEYVFWETRKRSSENMRVWVETIDDSISKEGVYE